MSFIRRLFCKHQWAVLDKTVVPSPMEIAKKNGNVMQAHSELQALRITKEIHVLTLTCPECGALKITKTASTVW